MKHLAWQAAILLGLSTAMTTCSSDKNQGTPERPVPVRTNRVVQERISIPVHATGRLAPREEMRLSFKVGGIVQEINVEEGRSVKQADTLATLKLDEVAAQADRARSALEKAERDLERVRRLFADGAAALEQVQNAETAVRMARSNLEIAVFNLDHSSITAPDDGLILKRLAEPNELVAPGSPVFVFASSSGGWVVRTGVTDRDMIRLQLGDSAAVSFELYDNVSFAARVSEIAGTADPLTGTYEVELAVEEDGRRLVSGLTARVDIFPRRKTAFYLIPIESLVEADGTRGYVFVPSRDGRQAERVPVRIAHVFSDRIAVSSGLEDADRVITQGALYLSQGSPIKTVNLNEPFTE